MRGCAPGLLPEITRRVLVDSVEYNRCNQDQCYDHHYVREGNARSLYSVSPASVFET